jgi:hypothetical protein
MNALPQLDTERNAELDHLSCELTSAVYNAVLRGSTPHNWLELQLNLWNAIKTRLEVLREVKQIGQSVANY